MSDQRLEELFNNFAVDYQEISGSEQAENFHYTEADVDLLASALNSPELGIRAKAYRCLQRICSESPETQADMSEVLAEGILLRPGDRIYSVYKACVWYDDEYYHLEYIVPKEAERHLEEDSEAEEFESQADYAEDMVEDSDDYIHSPERISRHVFRTEAADAAIALHRKFASEQDYILEFELNSDFDFLEWLHENDIVAPDASGTSPVGEGLDQSEFMGRLIHQLKLDNELEMLGDLCLEMIGSFTFVREETIQVQTYLKEAEL